MGGGNGIGHLSGEDGARQPDRSAKRSASTVYTVRLLGEEGFSQAMDRDNRAWRDGHVFQGTFLTADGTLLNCYHAPHENPRGTICIIHGFCEFWPKYHEMAWYLWKAGFSVFFLEQRGHGYSEGKCARQDLVDIKSYDEYAEDLRSFIDLVVLPESDATTRAMLAGGQQGSTSYRNPLIMLAHSMGGAVGALILEKYPQYFCAAVLCSPMLALKKDAPDIAIYASWLLIKLKGQERQMVSGQERFNPKPDFGHSSCLSKARFLYQLGYRIKDAHYRMSSGTNRWAVASITAGRRAIGHAWRIAVPVLMFGAGHDHLVDVRGLQRFANRSRNTRYVFLEDSKHEVFNGTDAIRLTFYRQVFGFLDRQAGTDVTEVGWTSSSTRK